jgi:hypothetical protein
LPFRHTDANAYANSHGYSNSNTYSNSNAYSYSNGHSYGNANGHSYGNANSHSYGNANTHADSYSDGDTYRDTNANASRVCSGIWVLEKPSRGLAGDGIAAWERDL